MLADEEQEMPEQIEQLDATRSVADHHAWFVGELDRLASAVKLDPTHVPSGLLEIIANARAHSEALVANPLHREPIAVVGVDPRTAGMIEMHAALVQSAHAEAALAAPNNVPPKPDSWLQRLRDRIFGHAEPNAQRYGDFDVHWLEALAERLTAKKAAFSTAPPADLAIGAGKVRLAIVGDWGTGLPESDLIGTHMLATDPDYTIHLGDVYYAGTVPEEERYVELWPGAPGKSLSLNSNHEMYSGGHGYFEATLGSAKFALQQHASYFVMRHEHFLIIGLDSAYYADDFLYQQGNLDDVQLRFVRELAAANPTRNIVILTHHHGLDLDNAPTRMWSQVLGAVGRPFLWVWGHIHAGVAHEPRPFPFPVFARCVGHGGVPHSPFTAAEAATYAWAETRLADDRDEAKRALNGFYTLEIDGATLTERFIDERGDETYSSVVFRGPPTR